MRLKNRFIAAGILLLLASCQAQKTQSTIAISSTPDPLLASSCQVALLGTWEEDGDSPRMISIRNYAGIYHLTYTYPDGSTESVVLGVKNVDGVVRFYEDAEKLEGEYFTIGTDGSLRYISEKGLIKSLPKTN